MEVLSFAKEVLQSAAEHAASYQIGQTALKHLDKALWVVEKCARWAVPPPLEQDDRPPQELVRPLPWVFFLIMLITLRITRESISLLNLVLGKPPLRSADVVMYIQSKRRYLRTLKYQGGRVLRARSGCGAPPAEPWYSGLTSLVRLTMCFRGAPLNYGNNNTTHVSNNDEVLVVKRVPRGRQEAGAAACDVESPMERLIEKMMTDLNDDSEDDSDYKLTNAGDVSSTTSSDTDIENEATILENPDSSIVKTNPDSSLNKSNEATLDSCEVQDTLNTSFVTSTPDKSMEETLDETADKEDEPKEAPVSNDEAPVSKPEKQSPKAESQNFILSEKCLAPKPPSPKKMANGRAVKSTPRKKGGRPEGRDADVPVVRITPAQYSCDAGKGKISQSHQ